MPDLNVRRATSEDCEILAEFNCRLAMETEGRPLDRPTVLAGVRNGLKMSEDVQYWVAEVDGCVIGQLMLTREWSDWRNGWMVWLQSVYVAESHRRAGVFRRLLQQVIAGLQAQETTVVGMRLYVERENSSALAVYQRSGFTDAGYNVQELFF